LKYSMMFGHKKTPSNWNVQLLGVTSNRVAFFVVREKIPKTIDIGGRDCQTPNKERAILNRAATEVAFFLRLE
uniref:hypothetical protein n=1 Tax=Paraglaciecola sp. 20A4 TaxID=2687288 RepID=UPI0019808627